MTGVLTVQDEISGLLSAVKGEQMSAAAALFADRERRWFCSGQGRSGLVAQDFATSLRLLTEGTVRAQDIVTSVFEGLDAAAAAFHASTDPEECKVLVRL